MMKYKLFLYLFLVTCAHSRQILKCEFAKALKTNGVKMEHIPACKFILHFLKNVFKDAFFIQLCASQTN